MEIIGILVLCGIPLAAYNLFIKDDHLALIAAEDIDIKGKFRTKIFKVSSLVCLGSTLVFHLVMSALGAPAFMWAIITVPIVFLFNILALLLIMEVINRRHA